MSSDCGADHPLTCCCRCIYLIPAYASKNGVGFKQQVGFVCKPPQGNRVYLDWPEHSVGCELFYRRILT